MRACQELHTQLVHSVHMFLFVCLSLHQFRAGWGHYMRLSIMRLLFVSNMRHPMQEQVRQWFCPSQIAPEGLFGTLPIPRGCMIFLCWPVANRVESLTHIDI